MYHYLVYFWAIRRCGANKTQLRQVVLSYLQFSGVSLRLLLNICHIFCEEQINQLRYSQGEIDGPYSFGLFYCLEPQLFV